MTNSDAIIELIRLTTVFEKNTKANEALQTAIAALEKHTCGTCMFLNPKIRNSLGFKCVHPDRPFTSKESVNACMKRKCDRGCSKWVKK